MTIISILSVLTSIFGVPQPDPRIILEQADKACRQLQTIRYSVDTTMGSLLIRATYTEKRIPGAPTDARSSLFHVEGERRDGTGSVDPFEYAFDGRILTIRGEGDSIRTQEDPDEYFMGQHLGMNMMGQMPYFNGIFGKRLKEGKLKYIGKAKIGKWSCDVLEIGVKLMHPERGEIISTSRWAFDNATHLPVQSITGSITETVTAFTPNPSLRPDAFRLTGRKIKGPLVTPQTQKLLEVGTVAPSFSLKDASGKVRSLKEFRGKVVLIDFWGTWCAPCRKSMPILQGLYEKYRAQGFVILGIAVADKEMDPAAYMKRQMFTYQLLLNGDKTAKEYKAAMLPTMYLLDRSGKIVFRQAGTDREDKSRLTRLIEGLIKRKP